MADLSLERGVEGHERLHISTLQVEKLVPVLGSLDGSQLCEGKKRSYNSPKFTRILLGCLFFHDESKVFIIMDRGTNTSTEGTRSFTVAFAIRVNL